jgi:hypothetical protein
MPLVAPSFGAPLSSLARSAQRTHYLDLIQIYTGLGDEEIDLILMHLPRVARDRELSHV